MNYTFNHYKSDHLAHQAWRSNLFNILNSDIDMKKLCVVTWGFYNYIDS